jgi:hypothetical protein
MIRPTAAGLESNYQPNKTTLEAASATDAAFFFALAAGMVRRARADR